MIRTWLARHVFYPAQDALRGRISLRMARALEESQWWDSQRLDSLQCLKLQQLILHASANCPFYADRLADAGIDPAAVQCIDDLRDLPVLSKAQIRAAGDAMVSGLHGSDLVESCTSGSTGSPLIFSVGSRRCSADVAARIRAHQWWDVRIGDPVVYLWGSKIEVDRQDELKAVRDWLINEKLLSAFELTDSNLHRYADTFAYVKPYAMYSYASTLWRFAQFIHQHRPELKGVVRRVAFATGEQMLPEWRTDIINHLECSVAEEYGCREGGLIAHECPSGSYHITAENIIVEILDDQDQAVHDGTEGRLVVTHLDAYAMPFIRYDTGDRAALLPGTCECGRVLPMMSRPQGRSFEFLERHDGTRITGVSLSRDLKEVEGIEQYRLIQETRQRVRVLLVIQASFEKFAAEARMREFVEARIGPETVVVFEYFDELPPHRSGKYRYIVNAIGASADD
ncbi:MAG: phenylacetate--CoA ligase family protein [Planctomycetes bacterium]|nr:phenylacetate--CoA ligase family protein [Planctomycetota bacterium]